MIQVAPQNDLRSVGQLTADFQISVREVEGLIVNLKIRCWRFGGILHIDAIGAKRIAAELRKQTAIRTRPTSATARRFSAKGAQ